MLRREFGKNGEVFTKDNFDTFGIDLNFFGIRSGPAINAALELI